MHFIFLYCLEAVANFNGQYGCQKCTTIGEFSYISNTNIFPRTECEKRTDAKFRERLYGSHHKCDSPLLNLDIDMVEQFVVADSLHLLHLGLMKRLLFGWRDGTFRQSDTKWRAQTTHEVSDYLKNQCKMPAEFHRAVRGLDCLPHWKATEYRTFLHDVERFGELESFSAYPFENQLGKIKRMLRTGHRPLAQIAKRIMEEFSCTSSNKTTDAGNEKVNTLSKRNDGANVPDSFKSSI